MGYDDSEEVKESISRTMTLFRFQPKLLLSFWPKSQRLEEQRGVPFLALAPSLGAGNIFWLSLFLPSSPNLAPILRVRTFSLLLLFAQSGCNKTSSLFPDGFSLNAAAATTGEAFSPRPLWIGEGRKKGLKDGGQEAEVMRHK